MNQFARLVIVFSCLMCFSAPVSAAEDYTGLAYGMAIALVWLGSVVVVFLVGAVLAVRERSWVPLLLPVLYIGIGVLLIALVIQSERLLPNSHTVIYAVGACVPILAGIISYWWYRAIRRGY